MERRSNPDTRQRARELRRQMTEAEQALWSMLRKHRVQGFYFRRQHPIGHYIVDFCCSRSRLCVEVDGPVHDLREERDANRAAWLESQGYTLLRFPNEAVLNSPEQVVAAISRTLRDKHVNRSI